MTIRFTTYNIRLNTTEDGDWAWPARAQYVLAELKALAPDVWTVEEALPEQLAELKQLAGYSCVWVHRDNGVDTGEAAAIFFRTARFKLLAEGHAWVSRTPTQPSLFPGAAAMRVYQWAHLQDQQSSRKFTVVTTHLDHVSVAAREFGVQQILTQFAATHEPLLVTGDFNMTPTDAAYAETTKQLRDAVLVAPKRIAKYAGTSQEDVQFIPHDDPYTTRIDYFFVNSSVQVLRYAVDTTISPAGKYASDHFPVSIDVAFS